MTQSQQRRTISHPSPSATPIPGCRERSKADIRHRLFRSALKLFASRGFAATTVEDITRSAGVAKGTFFNYFPTKEHLFVGFAEMRLDILRAARDRALDDRAPLQDILRRLLDALAQEPGESRGLARTILVGGLSGEPMTSIMRMKLAEGRDILAAMMEIGQRRGEIRRDWPAHDVARLFQQVFFGSLYLWALDPHLNIRECLDTTFAFFWAGVGAREKKSSRKRSS